MTRALRIEYPGAIYQVMNRGDRRKPVLRGVSRRVRHRARRLLPCQSTSDSLAARYSCGGLPNCRRNAMMKWLGVLKPS